MKEPISAKISRLNEAILHGMAEESNNVIVKNFTEESIKMLDADFGYMWGKFNGTDTYNLAYKSPKTPPGLTMIRRKNPLVHKNFDSNVKQGNYKSSIERYLKSYLIIPIRYVNHNYGSIILCYKKRHNFSKEELALSDAIGNVVAQAVTVNWLLEKEQKDLALAQKQKETEILLRQEKLKTEFIANATHELRTPLAIIRGNVDLALSNKGLKTCKSALSATRREVSYLAGILADLALFTAHGSNFRKTLNEEEFDLIPMLRALIKRLKSITHKKNISLSLKNERKSILINGDNKYMERVFLNLIKNAITYGRKNGKVSVEVSTGKKEAVVKVVDDGIGISSTDLPKIFEHFFRTEKARKIRKGGVGLGLALSKWVVEAQGGTIDVKSSEGNGTTFTVTLPLA